MPRKSKRTSSELRGLSKNQQKSVKKIALKTIRSKQEKKSFGTMAENVQLYHNKPIYHENILINQQGVQDPAVGEPQLVRVGDEIYLKNVNMRFWLSNKLDRPNVMYKAYMFWYQAGTTLTDAIVFETQTNKMLDRLNLEKVSLIDSKTIFSGASYENGTEKHEHSYLMTLNGNWKGKKIIYENSGTTPKDKQIGVALVCYDAYGTLQTDNIASHAYNVKVSFGENA